jgi:hypothetical protein
MKTAFCFLLLFLFILPLKMLSQLLPQVKDTLKPIPAASIPAVPPEPDSNIHVTEPALIKNTIQLVYDYQRYSLRNSHGTSPGFRIQIDFGQERNALTETKTEFTDKYPAIPAYLTYKQPYFRLSIGDFRTKLDAVRLLNSIKKDYPAAFIVADRIVPPPL